MAFNLGLGFGLAPTPSSFISSNRFRRMMRSSPRHDRHQGSSPSGSGKIHSLYAFGSSTPPHPSDSHLPPPGDLPATAYAGAPAPPNISPATVWSSLRQQTRLNHALKLSKPEPSPIPSSSREKLSHGPLYRFGPPKEGELHPSPLVRSPRSDSSIPDESWLALDDSEAKIWTLSSSLGPRQHPPETETETDKDSSLPFWSQTEPQFNTASRHPSSLPPKIPPKSEARYSSSSASIASSARIPPRTSNQAPFLGMPPRENGQLGLSLESSLQPGVYLDPPSALGPFSLEAADPELEFYDDYRPIVRPATPPGSASISRQKAFKTLGIVPTAKRNIHSPDIERISFQDDANNRPANEAEPSVHGSLTQAENTQIAASPKPADAILHIDFDKKLASSANDVLGSTESLSNEQDIQALPQLLEPAETSRFAGRKSMSADNGEHPTAIPDRATPPSRQPSRSAGVFFSRLGLPPFFQGSGSRAKTKRKERTAANGRQFLLTKRKPAQESVSKEDEKCNACPGLLANNDSSSQQGHRPGSNQQVETVTEERPSSLGGSAQEEIDIAAPGRPTEEVAGSLSPTCSNTSSPRASTISSLPQSPILEPVPEEGPIDLVANYCVEKNCSAQSVYSQPDITSPSQSFAARPDQEQSPSATIDDSPADIPFSHLKVEDILLQLGQIASTTNAEMCFSFKKKPAPRPHISNPIPQGLASQRTEFSAVGLARAEQARLAAQAQAQAQVPARQRRPLLSAFAPEISSQSPRKQNPRPSH